MRLKLGLGLVGFIVIPAWMTLAILIPVDTISGYSLFGVLIFASWIYTLSLLLSIGLPGSKFTWIFCGVPFSVIVAWIGSIVLVVQGIKALCADNPIQGK